MICWLCFSALWVFETYQDAYATRAARIDTVETIAWHDATIARWGARYTYLELPPQADSTIIQMYSPLLGSPVRVATQPPSSANRLTGTRSRYDSLAGSQRLYKDPVSMSRQAGRSVCV